MFGHMLVVWIVVLSLLGGSDGFYNVSTPEQDTVDDQSTYLGQV